MDSNKTELNDRTLWFDGSSTVPEKKLEQLLALGTSPVGLFVDKISDDIAAYNQLVGEEEQILVKNSVDDLDFTWKSLPFPYDDQYLPAHFIELLMKEQRVVRLNYDEFHKRLYRIDEELKLYEEFGLMEVLRTLNFIINRLHKENIVWGVGRGSSVASYILYLIGVHDVDSVQYDLHISDFLRIQ